MFWWNVMKVMLWRNIFQSFILMPVNSVRKRSTAMLYESCDTTMSELCLASKQSKISKCSMHTKIWNLLLWILNLNMYSCKISSIKCSIFYISNLRCICMNRTIFDFNTNIEIRNCKWCDVNNSLLTVRINIYCKWQWKWT